MVALFMAVLGSAVGAIRRAVAGGIMLDGRPLGDHTRVEATVEAAQRALRNEPWGPNGPAAAHVFAYADKFTPLVCHLARSVEAAGGWLHVLGLRDGLDSRLPWGDVEPSGSKTRENEPWHFADKSVMMKKHVYLARAIRQIPANSTVIFVDAFDVLFQRPLEEIVASYRRMAGPAADAAGGRWPVIYGGELNCWPFPHDGGRVPVPRAGAAQGPPSRVHTIPRDAALSADHHGDWRFGYGDRSPWNIPGKAVCGEWLSRGAHGPPAELQKFPFLCAGTFMGTASALRRILRRLFALYVETREYHDQALLALLLLRNRSLGFVDTSAQLFLGLHGHDELRDLERPLCRGTYFERHSQRGGMAVPEKEDPARHLHKPVPGYKAPDQTLVGLSPPAMRGKSAANAPSLIHFNGNGKRHLMRCIEEFRKEGILGGEGEGEAECTFYDHDRRAWQRYR